LRNLNLSRFNANNLNLGSVVTGLASYITQETQIAKVTFRILVTEELKLNITIYS